MKNIEKLREICYFSQDSLIYRRDNEKNNEYNMNYLTIAGSNKLRKFKEFIAIARG